MPVNFVKVNKVEGCNVMSASLRKGILDVRWIWIPFGVIWRSLQNYPSLSLCTRYNPSGVFVILIHVDL